MEAKGESSTSSSIQQLPSVVNPITRITPNLLDGNNYKDWSYSARMAIGGAKRLGHIDGRIEEPLKDDPKYSEWVSKNMLVMSWILNSMEESLVANFKYFDTSKERQDY